MKRLPLFLTASVLLTAAPLAFAATFQQSDRFTLLVPVQGDLYVAGQQVRVDKDVAGDVLAAGNELSLTGGVQQSVMAAGGKVVVGGEVGDDVRVAGGDVTVEGTVDGDVVVFGGTVDLTRSAVVHGDVVAYGGNITLLGSVDHNVRIKGKDVMLGGEVRGNADVQAADLRVDGKVRGIAKLVSQSIALAPGAFFAHNVFYWQAAGPLHFGQSLAGQASFHPEFAPAPSHSAAGIVAAITFVAIVLFLWELVVLALFVFLTKTLFVDAGKYAVANPWWSLLWGFLYLVLTPIAIVLLLVTIIGIPFGLLLLALYGFSFLFFVPIASVVLAHWVNITYRMRWGRGALFGISVVMLLALKLLVFIPILGWLIRAVLVLLCLGAYMAVKWKRMKKIL